MWVQGLSSFRFRALVPQTERGRGAGTGEWLLSVVGGAGADVSLEAFSYSRVFVDPAIDVAVIVIDLPERDDAVDVLLHFGGGGGGAAALVGQGVFVGELGGIGLHHPTHVENAVAGVLVPLVVQVEPAVGDQLQDLVGGRLGPARARQGDLPGHDRSGDGGSPSCQ